VSELFSPANGMQSSAQMLGNLLAI
jgi:hypothetical protein